jgi:GAF domain-containing protein
MKARSPFWFDRGELGTLFRRLRAEPTNAPTDENDRPTAPPLAGMPANDPQPATGVVQAPANDTDASHQLSAAAIAVSTLRCQFRAVASVLGRDALREGSVAALVREVTESVAITLDVDRVSVWIAGDTEGVFEGFDRYERVARRHEVVAPLPVKDVPRFIAALQGASVVAVQDARTDHRADDLVVQGVTAAGTRSILTAPITRRGAVEGVVCVERSGEPRRWSLDDEHFVVTLTDVLSLALDVAALRGAETARAEGEARLKRFSEALMGLARSEKVGHGDLDEAMREITQTAARALNTERSSVWLYNPDKTAIYCLELYIRGTDQHVSDIELRAESFPRYFKALLDERFIAADDAHTDARTSEFSESYLKPLGINSMLDAPIRVGGRMVGVLCNEHVGPARRWTLEEEQFAGSVADFVALAMEAGERRQAETELRQVVAEMTAREAPREDAALSAEAR